MLQIPFANQLILLDKADFYARESFLIENSHFYASLL